MSVDSDFIKFLDRVNLTDDFPVVSHILQHVNKIVESDIGNAKKLAEWVMQDVNLTKNLLQTVNSADFIRYGGNITSVTRAIELVGFNKIKAVASSLIALNFLENKTLYSVMQDSLSETFLASIIASNLDKPHVNKGFEELMVFCLFSKLGKLLTAHYFDEEFAQIHALVEEKNLSESEASKTVLGISYEEISARIAAHWGFPPDIVNVIYPKSVLSTELFDLKNAMFISLTISNMIISQKCSIENIADYIVRKYGAKYGYKKEYFVALINKSITKFKDQPACYGINLNAAYKKIKSQMSHHLETSKQQPLDPATVESALNAGTQEIFTLLMSDEIPLSDILNKAIDVLHEALKLDATCLFKVNPKAIKMEKMYFHGGYRGDLSFPITPNNAIDIFQISIHQHLDLLIENAESQEFHTNLPDWYISKLNNKSLMLLPLVLREKCVGLIYAGSRFANHLNLPSNTVNLVKTIRNQMLIAIKQKM